MDDIESMVKYHDDMLRKHDEEISELREMGIMHEARLQKLETLIENSQRIEASLVNAIVDMNKSKNDTIDALVQSQNKMMWKIVGIVAGLVGTISMIVGWLHM